DDGELRRRDALSIALVEQEPALPDWGAIQKKHKLAEFLDRFGLKADLDPAAMSGGERKRAALAAAFALEPELLLLDEPTNHLDIEGIVQLERLAAAAPALLVITHDRAFLDDVATRIIELDRGALRSYPAPFSAY